LAEFSDWGTPKVRWEESVSVQLCLPQVPRALACDWTWSSGGEVDGSLGHVTAKTITLPFLRNAALIFNCFAWWFFASKSAQN